MDPLSIAASTIAVIQLAANVIQYIIDAKDAGDDRQRILYEITSVHGFLYLLKNKAEQPQWDETFFETMKSLNAFRGPLEQFKIVLERLATKLRPTQGLKKFGKALTWPFQKQEIEDILSSIERQKSLFSLALQNDHM